MVTCTLDDNGVTCVGEQNFVDSLNQKGIFDYTSTVDKKLFPKDGLAFLEQLKFNFKSGYLNASDVKER